MCMMDRWIGWTMIIIRRVSAGPCNTHISLSGLGSLGVSSKTCVGRAAKERWVKTWVRSATSLICGSGGRGHSGPHTILWVSRKKTGVSGSEGNQSSDDDGRID